MKKTIICLIVVIMQMFIVLPSNGQILYCAYSKNINNSDEINLKSKAGYLIDFNSGKILFEKNSDERLPIASMTKLATLWVVFDAIDKGIIKESDSVSVSEKASNTGGSSAFLDAGSTYKLSELIKTVIIASANDSSVAIAEYVSGSEDLFVSKMNKFSSELNLNNTHFENCTGLPIENHYSCAKDMAVIYKQVCNHEIYKRYSKIWVDDFIHPSGRKTGLVNTNRLVKTYEGVEGGKTGYTNAAKFCLTASAKRGNLRLIGVIIGAEDSKTRFAEMTMLFNYGFSNYDNKLVANKDVPLAIIPVKQTEHKIEIYPQKDIYVLIDKGENKSFSTDYKVNEIKAPIKANDVVGKLFIFDENNMVIEEVDVVVKQNIDKVSFKERLRKFVVVWWYCEKSTYVGFLFICFLI